MCGITGLVTPGDKDPASIERMTELLRHRGPDSSGIWRSEKAHLGHRRLSILDLSSAGAQPMRQNGQVLVYNGEVYNFGELRQELSGEFQSQTDSEVVLRCFREFGPDCLGKLHGMFAFAVWDEATEELFLARDRFGIKPLYYRFTDGGIAFASEAAPLLELGRPEIDVSALRDYLVYGYVPTPKTPWKGIFKLPAAHFLRWKSGDHTIERYWRLEARQNGIDRLQAVEELDVLVEQAVRESSVSDVPLGLFLSGGVDSGAIASYSAKSILAFTLRPPETHRDESDAATALCGHLGLKHHVVNGKSIDLPAAVDAIVSAFDEPFGDSAGLSVWLLSRAISEHVKVALSGEGGDEIFYGYRWHGRAMTEPSSRLAGVLSKLLPALTKPARSYERRSLEGIERYAAFACTFTLAQLNRLLGPVFGSTAQPQDDLLWHFRKYWREDLPLQQRVQWADFHTYLPDDLLTKVDRASMAWSLEVRPPFLDHRLVEFSTSLDAHLHRDPATDKSKMLLRSIIEPKLPDGYLNRPKRGFNLAIRRWVSEHSDLWKEALNRLQTHGFIRLSHITDFTNDQVWSLLILDRWLARNMPSY
ncbi:MAG: asparagine synthase (glutamine-hydrolyzing) [Deltaproteobacteria bacterium]|nr:asparagine synthase (glutamine-hydrolyzing) [Deltaproteobacteria bacterium]